MSIAVVNRKLSSVKMHTKIVGTKAFQKIYSKQNVDDSSEAFKKFLDSLGDTKRSEYLKSKVLTDEESNGIESEITISELQYTLFTKVKGSSAPEIDGFTVNWLIQFRYSLKLMT